MNEKMGESLSALMDDEANELEIERILVRIGADSALRETWQRYNSARHSLQGHHLAHRDWDISVKVRAALGGTEKAEHSAAKSPATGSGVRQRLFRPLASFAVAASVAATVVIGGQQLAQLSDPDAYEASRSVATSASPVGMVNSLGATAVRASYGNQAIPVLQPATRNAYDELALRRSYKYMQQHAEQAALNSPQGLLPFARVPEIRE